MAFLFKYPAVVYLSVLSYHHQQRDTAKLGVQADERIIYLLITALHCIKEIQKIGLQCGRTLVKSRVRGRRKLSNSSAGKRTEVCWSE